MTEVSTLIPSRDLDFLLFDWLDMNSMLLEKRYDDCSRETIDAVIELSTRLAAGEFLPHYKKTDSTEPHLEDEAVCVLPEIGSALKKYAELGFFGAGFPDSLGGMGLPNAVCAASFAQFAAANIATSAYPMLTTANARLIANFCTPEQINVFALPQIEGKWFGTMCLSESQAGSSLADIRVRAVKDGDDKLGARYRITGNKMWISGGDQNISENIVHLVLAKIQQSDGSLPEGTQGLSLFIVPKVLPDGARNEIAVAGLNHKMGYRGTANCLLNFGEKDGAIGWRVGAPGEGLRQMFSMMNEARINVGLGASALAMRGFALSKQYANERLQGRSYGQRDGDPVPIIKHPDVKRMLLQQKAYAEGALALCLYCSQLVDAGGDSDAASLLGLLTPVAKTWPSEYGLATNDIAIQIHGGYGYTRDFDVEQLYRDNRLNPIHEGTTGIQALDLLGRKILRGDDRGIAVLRERIFKTIDKAEKYSALRLFASDMRRAILDIDACIETLKAADTNALDNATLFLRAFGHVVLAWIWLDLGCAAANAPSTVFAKGKMRACRFFFESELPSTRVWLKQVASLSDVAASAAADQF